MAFIAVAMSALIFCSSDMWLPEIGSYLVVQFAIAPGEVPPVRIVVEIRGHVHGVDLGVQQHVRLHDEVARAAEARAGSGRAARSSGSCPNLPRSPRDPPSGAASSTRVRPRDRRENRRSASPGPAARADDDTRHIRAARRFASAPRRNSARAAARCISNSSTPRRAAPRDRAAAPHAPTADPSRDRSGARLRPAHAAAARARRRAPPGASPPTRDD